MHKKREKGEGREEKGEFRAVQSFFVMVRI